MFAPDNDWGAADGVRVLFTTRRGGAGAPPFDALNLSVRAGDAPDIVRENRRRLAEHLPSAPKWLRQTHGNKIVCADRADDEPEADGACTFSRGVVCAVLAADCLPVFLRAQGEGVCVAHAGWRGVAAGVLENGCNALRQGSAADITARIGPGISAARYPVGEETRAALMRCATDAAFFTPTPDGKFLADLKGLARQRLLDWGATHVQTDPACTYSDPARYFSARRDGVTGRMAGLIWRE